LTSSASAFHWAYIELIPGRRGTTCRVQLQVECHSWNMNKNNCMWMKINNLSIYGQLCSTSQYMEKCRVFRENPKNGRKSPLLRAFLHQNVSPQHIGIETPRQTSLRVEICPKNDTFEAVKSPPLRECLIGSIRYAFQCRSGVLARAFRLRSRAPHKDARDRSPLCAVRR
jgi:hypothetical protein